MSAGNRQLQALCSCERAADALADLLRGAGYQASSDGATVRTDAPMRTVSRQGRGLLVA